MRKLYMAVLLLLCVSLSGCGWLDGQYASVTPHRQQSISTANEEVRIENYLQLRTALEEMVQSGTENRVIFVDALTQSQLDRSLDLVGRYIKTAYPLGAYAVEDVTFDVGTSSGVPAVAVNITYHHSRGELLRIHTVDTMEEVMELITEALNQYDTSLVILVNNYLPLDIPQFISDYSKENPGIVMELPQVVTQMYPNTSSRRVLEIQLTYQTSRDDLRNMHEQVERIFDSSALYVTQNAPQSQKVAQLYTFLMERFDYQLKTSITPAYSLLSHGVGDQQSFATVFAEMCQRSGIECITVGGARSGEHWQWNMVLIDGYYYHVDLLSCRDSGGLSLKNDSQMTSYVWDYSAYPACIGETPTPPEPTQPPTEMPENPSE